MSKKNPGCELDLCWINNTNINLTAVNNIVEKLSKSRKLKDEYRAAWLLKAITCIDLTTLNGDDTKSNVARICRKAARPLPENILNQLGYESYPNNPIHTASICIYPSKVNYAVKTLRQLNLLGEINIASVAAGFPSGQMPLKTRLEEIKFAIDEGATEIDIVIDRSLVLTAKWDVLYQEILQMRGACGDNIHMKTILSTGELGTLNNVYKAALVAMMAGSDFIKTSTGKETINATLAFGIVMCRAIKEYQTKTGYKVGLKPAGGIKTSKDALLWLILIKEVLGDQWLNPGLFRFGASGLLDNIENDLINFVKS